MFNLTMTSFWVALVLYALTATQYQFGTTEAATDIGVCYGMQGNNLPPAESVIELYKKNGIGKIRLFEPDHSALDALRGSNIGVTLGMINQDIQRLAGSIDAVNDWFATNIEPYLNDVVFNYIAVGNEVIPGPIGTYVLQVMQHLQSVLDSKKISGIKVSTVVPTSVLGSSYPPSSGQFTADVKPILADILKFLSQHGSPLLVNVYPYFAYASDPANIRLDYAQFTATSPVVQDGSVSYTNIFDAMVDAFFAAMEVEGVSDVGVVVSESGWPSAGNGQLTTPELAGTYNQNFVKHILKNAGTPKRPEAHIEGYIFAIFNENLKPAGTEQNFGLFTPDMQPVYQVFPIDG